MIVFMILSVDYLLVTFCTSSVQAVLYCSFILFVVLLVMAACSIANIVKSSLGPVGLDKMLVDDVGVRHYE